MTAVAILAVGGLVGAIAALVWLAVRGDRRNDAIRAADKRTAEVTEERDVQRLRAERAELERDMERRDREELERVNRALTEELADAIENVSLGAGLLPGDVRGRLLRLAQARAAGGAVRADADEAVPDGEAAGGPARPDLPPLEDPRVL